uniref:Uncharacterized protein n=1 Tax=Cannabis sativa TaxID=3483 RepID=A0A803QNK7_CANSA
MVRTESRRRSNINGRGRVRARKIPLKTAIRMPEWTARGSITLEEKVTKSDEAEDRLGFWLVSRPSLIGLGRPGMVAASSSRRWFVRRRWFVVLEKKEETANFFL